MLKRLLKKTSLIIVLLICALCIFLCGGLSKDDGIPECGIVAESSPLAQAIENKAVSDGFIRFDDEESLHKALNDGRISMGMVLSADFDTRIKNGDTDGIISLIETHDAVLQSLYKYRMAAYIIEAYTPYLTSDLLSKDGFEISPEEMESATKNYLENEKQFFFTVESSSGVPLEDEHYSLKLTKGAISLLLFFALGIFALPFTDDEISAVAKRKGARTAILHYLLPSVLITVFLFALCVSLALIASDTIFESSVTHLIPDTLSYILFLFGIGILARTFFKSGEKLAVPMIIICILSLVYCPIFVDVTSLIGLSSFPKYLLPTTFFYVAERYTYIAVALFAVSIPIYAAVLKRRHRLK